MKKIIKKRREENSLSDWNKIINDSHNKRRSIVHLFFKKAEENEIKLKENVITVSNLITELNNLSSIYTLRDNETEETIDDRIKRISEIRKILNSMVK